VDVKDKKEEETGEGGGKTDWQAICIAPQIIRAEVLRQSKGAQAWPWGGSAKEARILLTHKVTCELTRQALKSRAQ